MPSDEALMFELAPVSLWLEDFSAVHELFQQLRSSGVTDLLAWLDEVPERRTECARRIQVLKVNQATLKLFEADSFEHLTANLDRVFRNGMQGSMSELQQLWDGKTTLHQRTINYTLSGKPLNIQLQATILPGHEANWSRVLLSIENITALCQAQERLAQSEAYTRGLFEHSPVSLWVEDFSAVKILLDEVREAGITDFRVFTDVHPEFVDRCMREIRVSDVNRQTLEMFCAPDKTTLLARLGDIFRDDMRRNFTEQLIDLWQGKLFQQREVVNYALDGSIRHIYMQFSVLPGYERDWSLVQVALTDISARKKAEAYLEFLGKHDVLTKLYNRSYYADELNRLQRRGPFPVTVLIVDLNSLKQTNDLLGHAAGDALLRRVGEVLNKAVDRPASAARIGGDEFVLLLPGTDEAGGKNMVEQLDRLVQLNNQFYPGTPLALSIGAATCHEGGQLEQAIHEADTRMYEAKRAYHSGLQDRRDETP